MDIIKKQIRVIQIQEHLELLTNTNSKHKIWLMDAINYWQIALLKLETEVRILLKRQFNQYEKKKRNRR